MELVADRAEHFGIAAYERGERDDGARQRVHAIDAGIAVRERCPCLFGMKRKVGSRDGESKLVGLPEYRSGAGWGERPWRCF